MLARMTMRTVWSLKLRAGRVGSGAGGCGVAVAAPSAGGGGVGGRTMEGRGSCCEEAQVATQWVPEADCADADW